MGSFLPSDQWFWGGGDTLWMLHRSDLVIQPSNLPLEFSTADPMKLSKFPKIMYIASSLTLCLGYFSGIMTSSKKWWGISTLIYMACWIRSLQVLITSQKDTGIYARHICSTDGTTNPIGLPGGSDITYKKNTFRPPLPAFNRIHQIYWSWQAQQSILWSPSQWSGLGGGRHCQFPWPPRLVPGTLLFYLQFLGLGSIPSWHDRGRPGRIILRWSVPVCCSVAPLR